MIAERIMPIDIPGNGIIPFRIMGTGEFQPSFQVMLHHLMHDRPFRPPGLINRLASILRGTPTAKLLCRGFIDF